MCASICCSELDPAAGGFGIEFAFGHASLHGVLVAPQRAASITHLSACFKEQPS